MRFCKLNLIGLLTLILVFCWNCNKKETTQVAEPEIPPVEDAFDIEYVDTFNYVCVEAG